MNYKSIIRSTNVLVSNGIPEDIINIIMNYCMFICEECYSMSVCDVCKIRCSDCYGDPEFNYLLCEDCVKDGWYYCENHMNLGNDKKEVHCRACHR
jgi:hypothetical protein